MDVRGRIVLRASIAFVVTYGVLMTAVFLWGADPIERYVNLWTAKTSAWALWLLGADGHAQDDLIVSSVSTFRIISECTVLYPAVIFVSAVVASPVAWKQKVRGVFLGLPILAGINLFRIVSLCYIDHWFPESLDTAHYVVWQSLMIFFTVLLWLLWVVGSKAPREPARA